MEETQVKFNYVGGVAEINVVYTVGNDPMLMKIIINCKTIEMEVDTGASVTIMSFNSFCKHFNNSKLNNCKKKYKCVSDDMLDVVGETTVHVKTNKEVVKLNFVVAKGSFKPLLGRNWLSVLVPNWEEIFKECEWVEVHTLRDEHFVEDFAKEFPGVFSKDRS